jgi:glycosyltransferase 2 family protein
MNIFEKPIVKKVFLILRILIPILLLSLLIYKVDFNAFLSHLRTYPISYLCFSTLLIICANLIFAIRWKYILHSVDIKVSNYQIIRLVFFSLFLSNFLPTSIGGDLVKLVGIVNVTDNEKKDLKVTSVLVDRIFSMLSKVLLLPFAVQFLHSITRLAGNASALGFFSLSFLPASLRQKISSYITAIKPWYSIKKIVIILGLSWISLAFTAGGYWLVAQPFGVPITYLQVLFMSILTYFAIILPISINGIGVQEGSYIYLFTLLSFTYDQAWTIALIYRLITILISIIGGIWMLIDGRELFDLMRKKDNVAKEMPV